VRKYEQTIGKISEKYKDNVTKRTRLKKPRHKDEKGSRTYFLSYIQRYIFIGLWFTCLMCVVQCILKIER